jgi:hypothetical protein
MATIPSLALVPSGYKASKVYSVLPTDGSGDFDFTRSGNATRVNSEGLIEVVSTNVPRLNYPLIDGVVSGCPSLLLEPIRINLFPYSEDFTNNAWTKTRTTAAANSTTSPNGGVNASLITATESTAGYVFDGATLTQGLKYFVSVFFKQGSYGGNVIISDFTESGVVTFNLTTKTIITSGIASDASYEDYGNGWFRVMASITPTISTGNHNIVFGNFGGVGNSIYIWGAQLEAGSYATSYIPNYGTALGVTRSAETCNDAGDVNTFNGSEGVLFVEMSALANDSTTRRINLRNSSGSNQIRIEFGNSPNLISAVLFNGANQAVINNSSNNILNSNKIAFKYKENDFALWINGVEVGTDISGTTIGAGILDRIDLSLSPNQTYSNIKQIQYFNTALTDLELQQLTTL